MACIYKYKDNLYTKEELVKFLNEEEIANLTPEVEHEVKKGVNLLFETNPELEKIGTQADYSAYLDEVFPETELSAIEHNSQQNIQGFKEYMKIQNTPETEYLSPTLEEEPDDANMYFNPSYSASPMYEYPVGEITSYRALKEQMLSNIEGKLVDVKRELKQHRNRSNYRDQLEHAQELLNAEKAELEKELKTLREQIKKSTFTIHNIVERDLERANTLATSRDPKDTKEAMEIADFIITMAERESKTIKSFAFGRHPLYTQQELNELPQSDQDQLDEWRKRAVVITTKVEQSNDAIVEDLVNGISVVDKLYGRRLTIADLTQEMKDVDWLSMFVMDINNGIFSQNGKLPQVAYYLFNQEMENAQAKYRILSDKIDNITPKVESELKKLGIVNKFLFARPADYTIFFQKDTNGLFGKGMNLVDFLSSEYYVANSKKNEEYREKYAKIASEKDPEKKMNAYNDLVKEKMKRIRKNEHVINPALLSVFRNDPIYGHAVFQPYISKYTQQQADEHEKLLLDLLGQKEYDKQIARMKTLLDDYVNLRTTTINTLLQDEQKTDPKDLSQKAQREINELSLKENPYYAARLTETGQKPQDRNTIYGPKPILPNLNSVLSIPKNPDHYDKNYKLIQSNSVLAEFYDLSRQISETMKAVFPSEIQAQLLDTSLNYIQNTVWDILLQDEGSFFPKLIKIIRKMWHDLVQAFGTDSNTVLSDAHLNWRTNEPNYEVNASFLTNNLSAIKAIKSVEISKFQSLSGLTDLSKVDTNTLNPHSKRYLEKILGKGSLQNPRVINVFKLLDSYAHHIKMQDSSPNLPKILKTYANIASQYEARNTILPVVQNIKNHYENINKTAQSNFGDNVFMSQVQLTKLGGKRVKAITQFESWFNRQILDNKGITGQFGRIEEKEKKDAAKLLKKLGSGIMQGIPLKGIYTLEESKNIKEMARILKTIDKAKLASIKRIRNLPLDQRSDSEKLFLESNVGIVNMLSYTENAGKTLSVSSILGAVIKYTGLKALALNLSSATTNLIEGQISNVLAAEIGDVFKPQNLNSVSPIDIMYANVVRRTTGIAGKKFSDSKTPIRVWKLDKIIDRYDIFADIANDVQHSSTETVLDSFASNVLMAPTRVTEYYNQAPFIAAVLADVMVKGKDAQGNDIETDLLDAVDRVRTPSGYIVAMKPEYNTPENRAAYLRDFSGMTKQDAVQYSKKYIDLKVKIDQGIKNAHGDYNKFGGMYAKEFVVGKALLSLRTWLPRQLYIRFAPEQDDLLLGVKGFKGFARSHITPTAIMAGGLTGLALGGLPLLYAGAGLGYLLNDVVGLQSKKFGAYSGTHWVNDLLITTQMLLYKLIGNPLNMAYLFVRPAVNYVSGKKTRRIINTTGNNVIVYNKGFEVRNAYTIMKGDRFTERDYKNYKANIRDITNMLTVYAIYFAIKLIYKPDDDEPDKQDMTPEQLAELKKERAEENLLVNKAMQLISQMTSYYNALDMIKELNPTDTIVVKTFENIVKYIGAAHTKIFGEDWEDIQTGGINRGKSRHDVQFEKTFVPSTFSDPLDMGFKSAMTHQWFHTKMDEWFVSDEDKAKKELAALRLMRKEE